MLVCFLRRWDKDADRDPQTRFRFFAGQAACFVRQRLIIPDGGRKNKPACRWRTVPVSAAEGVMRADCIFPLVKWRKIVYNKFCPIWDKC